MLTRRELLAALAAAPGSTPAPALLPKPVRFTPRDGAFALAPSTSVSAPPAARNEAAWLTEALALKPGKAYTRITLKIAKGLHPEAYRLTVDPRAATLSASTPAGLFYAAQTLTQLAAGGSIPCCEIEDEPRFPWRGAHLDVSRHFFPKPFILKFIDLLAAHKLNRFHFHLTDDQGWRLEIRKYPKLTSVGSMRRESRVGHELRPQGFDGKPHGGFYTQADIREIVAFAKTRHVTVVPEIEMPGHAQAALAAYPEFGVTGDKLEVWTQWGVSNNIFSPDEKGIRFLQDILTEVLELFPSPYIHVGGDETPPDQWKASPAVQARIKELGLKNETQLHGWFLGRMNEFLRSKGRAMIGWDEIIEGGPMKDAIVMSWRGEKGGIEAAHMGNDVIMTPDQLTYLNYYQSKDPKEPLTIGGLVDLPKIYGYDPVPAALSAAEARHVLGTQAQLWSEYMPDSRMVEYMAFPRLCALAEVAWSPAAGRSYQEFEPRLRAHLPRLKAKDVNFRPLD